MKTVKFIVFLYALLLFGSVANAASPVRFGGALGWAVDSSGGSSLSFNSNLNFFFNDHIGLGPFVDLFTYDGIVTDDDILSIQFTQSTIDTGGQIILSTGHLDDIELYSSFGVGYVRVIDSENALTFPIGFGAQGVFRDQGYEYAIGTSMNFHLTTLDVSKFIWNWKILTFEARF